MQTFAYEPSTDTKLSIRYNSSKMLKCTSNRLQLHADAVFVQFFSFRRADIARICSNFYTHLSIEHDKLAQTLNKHSAKHGYPTSLFKASIWINWLLYWLPLMKSIKKQLNLRDLSWDHGNKHEALWSIESCSPHQVLILIQNDKKSNLWKVDTLAKSL